MPGSDRAEASDQFTALTAEAARPRTVSFSAKVFIPITRLCRNRCAYCDYSVTSTHDDPFITPAEALEIARAGERAGCTEALFVAGDKPERRYPTVRAWLKRAGYDSTAHYTRDLCKLVLDETRLYPHTNVGALGRREIAELREVNASLGLMLESASRRLGEPGGPHYRCPDKRVSRRLEALAAAGDACALFTTGLLVGIGETPGERLESLLEIRRLHDDYGHIQEVIIQNLRPRPGATFPLRTGPSLAAVLDTVTMARRILGPSMNIQVPPNLALGLTGRLDLFLEAGANDWGGVSPVTTDYVNPDSPWPDLDWLRRETEAAGFFLRQRFPAYPEFVRSDSRFLSDAVKRKLAKDADLEGYVRNATWSSRLKPAGELLENR